MVDSKLSSSGVVTEKRRNDINWLLTFCVALIMLCEGFDLIIYSNIIPVLVEDAAMGVDKAVAGTIGSMAFVGMFVGGISAGRINDRLGSSKTIIVGIAWFSMAMLLAAFAQNAVVLAATRLFAGLGLGVVLPIAMALVREHASARKAAVVISVVMAGIPFGGLVATFVANAFLAVAGWRILMVIAGCLGFVLLIGVGPFIVRFAAEKRQRKESRVHRAKWTEIFAGNRIGLLMVLALTSFMFLMAYFGISTWLTQLMREFNLPMENSLQLMMTLNIGCVLGSLVTAWVAAKFNVKIVAMLSALLAGICLVAIAFRPTDQVLLFALVFFAGVGAISAQNLTNALVSNAFPRDIRPAALGFTLGFGRLGAVCAPIIGGGLLQAGFDPGLVLVWLGVADIAGLMLLFLYTRKRIIRSMKKAAPKKMQPASSFPAR